VKLHYFRYMREVDSL